MKYIQGYNTEALLSAFFKKLDVNELDNYHLKAQDLDKGQQQESLGFLSRIGRLQVFAVCETAEELVEYKRKVYGAPWVVWGAWESTLADRP